MTQRRDFAPALHGAITASGLTLDRIVHRLAERGFALSTATLSYWSRGRSRPERPESLAALSALEEILGVPAGSLRELLGDRVRRGRGKTRMVPSGELWGHFGAAVDQLMSQVQRPAEHRRVLSYHERYVMDAAGGESYCRVIAVLEAVTERAKHMITVYRDDTRCARLPTVVPVAGVRLGRVGVDTESHLMAAELWFDQNLRRGERTVVEYGLDFLPGGNRAVMCERRFAAPIRQYVLEVTFHPEAVPKDFRAISEPADGGRGESAELSIDDRRTVRAVWLDEPAGAYRIEWEWDRFA
ncbi:hypothetical protein [Kutzneria kofuensis]|uniref:Transcriptional regulator with XRE-family HTH domain n=1 Tax=Kutzneria kofuensis TaxID=103725 RepID=A0A7W9KJK7_9PSEU|nr:hypothetical protein [Kutzneria kofuensis]MBB5893744.1 transcriptional regulator with XRE-family HTH domain [Kutzneria kofuensis]